MVVVSERNWVRRRVLLSHCFSTPPPRFRGRMRGTLPSVRDHRAIAAKRPAAESRSQTEDANPEVRFEAAPNRRSCMRRHTALRRRAALQSPRRNPIRSLSMLPLCCHLLA